MAIWQEDLVMKNKFSRPGILLVAVRGLVIHWTGNPGATDENHASFFDGADGGGSRYASAHIFIDRDSATLIIPLNEVAYHANESACRIPELKASTNAYKGGNANLTTLSIEMCVEKDGTIHPDTVARTVQVSAALCKMYNFGINKIWRHHDITGKNCPAPWVANPGLFMDFKNRVAGALNQPTRVQHPSQPTGVIITGSRVTVKTTATHYATGQAIASFVKGSQYQVLQVKPYVKSNSKKAYLLSGIMSWVLEQDIVESGVSNGTPAPQPVAPPTPKQEFAYFPPGHGTWSVYPTNKQPVKKNAVGAINPTKFGGLTYQVLGHPYPDVVTIKTANWGVVNIYVGDPNSQLIWK